MGSTTPAGEAILNGHSQEPPEEDPTQTLPRTIDELLRTQATKLRNSPVIFYPSSGTNYVGYSLHQLDIFAYNAAQKYASVLLARDPSSCDPTIVALLGVSDLDYIVTLLAITKLGHAVAFLSPRIALPAYEHLLKLTGAKYFFYQPAFSKTAEELTKVSDIKIQKTIGHDEYGSIVDAASVDTNLLKGADLEKEAENTVWYFHSSGSSGLPKANKFSHKKALNNYRRMVSTMGKRTFVTVPVYHTYGIGVLFRAFMTGQPLHFYSVSLPMTQQLLIESMKGLVLEIFVAVPYALKLLSESEEGIELLRNFEVVTVAGAPCPETVGDFLTSKGVYILNFFGMTELGPQMTSDRPPGDKEWNYMSPLPAVAKYVAFEDRGAGLYELIGLNGSPTKSISNRPDGSYATKDLFEKHPTLENRWKYAGRIDDVIIFETGEKAIPLSLEGAVTQHELVRDAVVYGVQKAYLGIAVLLSDAASELSNDQVLEKLWPVIEASQQLMPVYAKISRDMILLFPPGTEYPQTDKKTVIRQAFYRQFSKEIEDSYKDKVSETKLSLSESELKVFLRTTVLRIMNLEDASVLMEDTDLFQLGLDSLLAAQLRSMIARRIDVGDQSLEINVVFENPSIASLARKLHSLRTGAEYDTESPEAEMKRLIQKFGTGFEPHIPRPRIYEQKAVLITGTTGALGAHILTLLSQRPDISKIYTLVRASNNEAAHHRLLTALSSRKLLPSVDRSKITALSADLSQPTLGLSEASYTQLTDEVTTVYHCAWTVNFNLRLSSFEDCLAGLHNLLAFCLKVAGPRPARFAFMSTIGTVSNPSPTTTTPLSSTAPLTIPESLPQSLSSAQPTGYARSKLIGEHICALAATTTHLAIPTSILRIGQIIGDSVHGIWSATEAQPLIWQSALTIGALPAIDEELSWVPVDVLAEAVLEIVHRSGEGSVARVEGPEFYNLINPRTFHWTRDLLPMLKNAGLEFETLEPPAWVDRLQTSNSDPAANPPVKLLEHFVRLYGTEDAVSARAKGLNVHTEKAEGRSDTFRGYGVPTEELIGKMVEHFREGSWKRAT